MLISETILSFSEAAKALPKINGRRPHATTLWRWARKGLKGVRLETRRVGARFVTSAEALERFSEALAAIDLPGNHPPPQTNRRGAGRHHAVDQAEHKLRNAGILD